MEESELENFSLDNSSLEPSRDNTVVLDSGVEEEEGEEKPACATPPPKKPTKEVLTSRLIKRKSLLKVSVTVC